MQPFCAPPVRSRRVRRRVSMPAIATVPRGPQVLAEGGVLRKFEARGGTSLTTRPAAKTCRDSTSSGLEP